MKKITRRTVNRPIIVQNKIENIENNLIKIDLSLDKIVDRIIKLFTTQ